MALNRSCVKHGWLVLNGRCMSDTQGRATFLAGTHKSVVDLAHRAQGRASGHAGTGYANPLGWHWGCDPGGTGGCWGGWASVWGHRGGCYGSPGLVGNGLRRLSPVALVSPQALAGYRPPCIRLLG